jgi:hypothetical protein
MGEFTKRVQSDKIPGPLRRSFTPKRWAKDFADAGPGDETDQRVYDSALIIHSKLESVRSRLKLSSSPTLSATTKLRAFVAAANHNFFVAQTKTREAIEKVGETRMQSGVEGSTIGDLAAEIKLELRGGFEWSPDEIVEALVDGIEVPVRFSLQDAPDLAGNPRMTQVEWDDIALELNLGIMFRHVEDLWDDCLWNGYRVIDKGRVKVFIPGDIDAIRAHRIGIARRTALAMGFSVMATRIQRGFVERGLLPTIRDVRAIERQEKRQVIVLSKPGESTSAQEELFVMRAYANEPYYSALLEESLPALDGITLSSVLNAWVVISRAALVLLESLAKREQRPIEEDSPVHTWLPEYAPVFQVGSLISCLSAAAGLEPRDGKRLVEFFTFRGKPGQEIWAQPLIPVGVSTVAPVFAAVSSPNLRRLVDVWMRQAGIDLGLRGPAFEAHIRVNVEESIATSKVLSGKAKSVKEQYKFRPTGAREEEIDLLFVIGATMFLGEVKCILEPTEAKGIAMHRRTVRSAAEQILRKAQAVKDHRAAFIADMKRFDIDLPDNFEVLPLIVISTSTHVGVPMDGVPVVDEYILEKFLFGELEDVAVTGPDLDIQKTMKTVFYTDAADAEAKAAQYFASPPQVRRLVNGIRARPVPVHAIDEQDWEGLVVAFDCVPTDDVAAKPAVSE